LKESAALTELARNFKTPLKASNEPTDEEVAEMVNLINATGFYKRRVTTNTNVERLSSADKLLLIRCDPWYRREIGAN
jgi:hypothetical protein